MSWENIIVSSLMLGILVFLVWLFINHDIRLYRKDKAGSRQLTRLEEKYIAALQMSLRERGSYLDTQAADAFDILIDEMKNKGDLNA